MSRRILVPVTFRGNGLSSLGRTAYLDLDEGGYDSPRHDPVEVRKQGTFGSFLRLQGEGKVLPVHFAIKSLAKKEQFDAIAKIFDPTLGEGELILEDRSCFPIQQYRVQCAPQQIIIDEKTDSALTVPLFAADPILEDTVADTTIDNITGVFVTLTLLNDGTYPSDRITLGVVADSPKLQDEGYTEVIEVAYANRSEFSLTGPGSGTWMLMLIESWDTATKVIAGEMTADGRDIAVFVDEVQVLPEKVVLDGFDTANTKVWIEISDSPAQFGILRKLILVGETEFKFERGDHGFRVGDYLTWENDAGGHETARVSAIDGRNITVVRSMRNTTAGALTGAGNKIYKSNHHIQIAWNYVGGSLLSRSANPDAPLIDVNVSNNLGWDWTDAPMWPEDDRRAGGFRRILYNGREDVPELRKNRLAAKTTLTRLLTTAVWQDLDPTVAKPNFDAIEFTACCGIKAEAGAIEYDCALDWPFAFQIIGRDLLGYDNIIFNRLGHETGAAHFPPRLYTDQEETPDGILSAVIFRARNMVVTTTRSGDIDRQITLLSAVGEISQQFRIDEDTQIVGIVVRVRDDNNSPDGFTVQVNEQDSEGRPSFILAGPFSGAGGIGDVFIEVCFFPTAAAAFTTDIPVLGAGDFHLGIVETAGGVGDFFIAQSDGSIYPKGSLYVRNAAFNFERIADRDFWFAILSLNADNQEEVLQQVHTGEFVVLDDIHFTFDPDRVPIVSPASEENCYYFNTTWAMNGETLTFRWLRRTADLGVNGVTIDVQEQTAIEDKFGDNIRSAIEVTGDPWLELLVGSNSMIIRADDDAQDEEHTVVHRSTWLA